MQQTTCCVAPPVLVRNAPDVASAADRVVWERMPDTGADRCRTFRTLHEAGCFVLPNPWDVGSARFLQHVGFPALATTSAGAAFAAGLPDGGLSRDAMLDHLRLMVAA